MTGTTYEEILALMQKKYRELTGFDADAASDVGIRLRVLAAQAELLHRRIDGLGRQMFPQTAGGTALERHAACRGLARKPARAAEGLLRFTREVASGTDIPIVAGITCATRLEPQVRFETMQAGVLRAGKTAVEIPARALDPGTQGNVSVGAVCLMVSAAPGITGVSNHSPFAGGADEETDDVLRARLLEAYREISNGANAAFYYDIAMQYGKVRSAQVIPRARGRGTVDIAVHCKNAADTNEVLPLLRQELRRRREIGVDVKVYSALRCDVDIRAEVAPQAGFEAAAVQDACLDALKSYMEALRVGEPLLVAHLVRRLLEVEGVHNARIAAPAADLIPGAGEIFVFRTLNTGGMSA